jgi:hypothetical protein
LNGTNVIQVTQERKQTATEFVIPDFDFVIVTTRNNQRFVRVKVDTPDRAIVLFESINDSSNSVVPTVVIV